MAILVQSSECCVCFELYTELKYPVALPCGHVFCCHCVQSIVVSARTRGYCPIDRQRFAESDTRRIYNNEEEETPRKNMAKVIEQLQQNNAQLLSLSEQQRKILRDLVWAIKVWGLKNNHVIVSFA